MRENTKEIFSPHDELDRIHSYYLKIQERIWTALQNHSPELKIVERKPNYETTHQIARELLNLSNRNSEYQEISQEFLIQIEKLRKKELEILNSLN
jgi:hypothetical protein